MFYSLAHLGDELNPAKEYRVNTKLIACVSHGDPDPAKAGQMQVEVVFSGGHVLIVTMSERQLNHFLSTIETDK